MIAALGLERHRVPQLGRERLRPGTRRHHRPLAGELAAVGTDRLEPPTLQREARRARHVDLGTIAAELLRQPLHHPMRIAEMSVFLDQDAARELARERGLGLAKLIGIELGHDDAVVASEPPGGLVLGVAVLRPIGPEVTLAMNQLRNAGIPRQRQQRLDRGREQGAECLGLSFDALRRARADKPDEPWRYDRQITPADRERPQRIEQPPRHIPDRTGHRHRHDRGAVEATGIAEGGAFAGRARVEHEDLVAIALQETRGGDAHHTRADNADGLAH